MKQKLAEVEAVQAYKRAAQLEAWQKQGQQVAHPAPAHVDKMRQWLESGDAILVAEAEVFFSLTQETLREGERTLEDGNNSRN